MSNYTELCKCHKSVNINLIGETKYKCDDVLVSPYYSTFRYNSSVLEACGHKIEFMSQDY